MAEDVAGEDFDILRGDKGSAIHEGAGPGDEGEVDGGAGRCSGADEWLKAGVDLGGVAGGDDEIDDVFADGRIHVDLVEEGAAFGDGFLVDDWLRGWMGGGVGHAVHDFKFVGFAGVADGDFEEEAVELGFGKLVSSLLIDGVLGGEDEKGLGEEVGFVAEGDLPLLHCFEEGGLDFRGGAVDFVGKDDVGEDRAELWFEGSFLGIVDHGADEVGREEVGGELDSGEAEFHGSGEGVDGEGLGEAGHSFEEDMAVAEHADDEAIDEFFLSDEDAADFVFDAVDPRTGGGDAVGELLGVVGGGFHEKLWLRITTSGGLAMLNSGLGGVRGWIGVGWRGERRI